MLQDAFRSPGDWMPRGAHAGDGETRAKSRVVCVAVCLAALVVLLAFPERAGAAPSVVGTIDFPGKEPLDVAVYEAGNKIFVTEDNDGRLYIFDGTTLQAIGTPIDVGGSAYDIAVNETEGKVYMASDKDCCTTGANPGNGKVSVIDADTNMLLSQFDPGTQGAFSGFEFGPDEVHDKVYLGFFSGTGVINAATDAFSLIPGAPSLPDRIVVNTVTNEVYVARLNAAGLIVIDGATLDVESVPWPSGSSSPLDLAVNEVENKAYTTMLVVPGQGEIGIMIYDRDTASFDFVGADDLEPLAFNQSSNKLFSGVQVGAKGAIVDGATDAFDPIDLPDDGFGAIEVRSSTDNAYVANDKSTVVVSGAYRCARKFDTSPDLGGGLVATSVAVNQTTGRVYVINRHQAGKLTMLQDQGPGCVPTPTVTAVVPSSPANNNTPQIKGSAAAGTTVKLYANAGCTGAPAAQGMAADFASPGLTVTVADDSTTTFRATATDPSGQTASDCSTSSVTYTEDTSPPAPPTLTGTDPDSPSGSPFPLVIGTAEPGSTVRLYTTPDCSGSPVAEGSAESFASPGFFVTVPENSSTTFHATATDDLGHVSPCSSSSVTYVQAFPSFNPPGTGSPGNNPTDGSPTVEEPLPKVSCPRQGRYRGSTAQGKKICFRRSRNGRRVRGFEFGIRARCDFGSIDQVTVVSGGTAVTRSGRFRLSAGDVLVKGRVAGRRAGGTVRTSITVFSGLIGSSQCDSGSVRWNARRR